VRDILPSDETLIHYLLGELSEHDQNQIEEKYFPDDGAFERLCALEDELIDRYVRGELSEAQRKRFEERFLQSTEQRKRIEFARSLVLSIPGPPVLARVHLPSKKAKAWLPFWSTPRLAVFLPAALGLVAIIVLGTWWLRHSHTPSETRVQQPQGSGEEQAARAPGQALPQAPYQTPESQIATLILTPDITRGTGNETRLVLSPKAEVIELIASLELVEFETYRAEIRRVGGQEVWIEKDLHPRETPPMKGVVLRVPAKVFANEDYILTLRGTAPSGRLQTAAEYSFRIVRK
jgi:hypothetical protein